MVFSQEGGKKESKVGPLVWRHYRFASEGPHTDLNEPCTSRGENVATLRQAVVGWEVISILHSRSREYIVGGVNGLLTSGQCHQ